MASNTRIPGTIIRSGSIPTTALGGGVVSSSLQIVSALPGGSVSSSAQIAELLPTNTVSSSGQVTTFLPTNTVSSSGQVTAFLPSDTVSSSAQVTAFLPTNTVSSSGQVTAFLPTGTVSGSSQVDITNTTNYTTFSSSLATVDTVQSSRLTAIENVTGSYATTGSNTFVAPQTISDTTNSTTYLDGALHIVGGMSVRKDVRVSGSMTVNGLLTAVSMSTLYVTASEYTIGTSKIILNDDDLVRFAGISITDSGSSSPATASIYWDSMKHKFIYENLSGSSYNSAMFIAGPKNTGSLGDEVGLTSGYVPYATGDDHISDSVMYQSGGNIGIGTTNPGSKLTVNGAAVITGSTTIIGNALIGQNSNSSTSARLDITAGGSGYDSTIDFGYYGTFDANVWNIGRRGSTGTFFISDYGPGPENNALTILGSSCYIGIGTANPANRLEVYDTQTTIPQFQIKETSTAYHRFGILKSGSFVHFVEPGNDGLSVSEYLMTINMNGNNVGIGTNIPSTKLDILTAAGANGIRVVRQNTFPVTGYGLVLDSVNDEYSNYAGIQFNAGGTEQASIRQENTGNIYFDSRVDTYLRPGGTLVILTNSTERMRITNSGSIGIGTTNPLAKLESSLGTRTLSITGTSYRGAAIIGRDLRDTNVTISDTQLIIDYTNIGVLGVTDNDGQAVGVMGYANGTGVRGATGVLASANNTSTGPAIGLRITSVTSTSGIPYAIYTDTSARVYLAGNIGIGTTNPVTKLDVRGSIASSFSAATYATFDSSTDGNLYITANAGAANLSVSTIFRSSTAGGAVTERMRINASGYVGIGSTSPNYTLEVAGLSAANRFVLRAATTGSFEGALTTTLDNTVHNIIAGPANGPTMRARWSGGTSNRYLEFGQSDNLGNYSPQMTIADAGNVGIGITSPAHKLHVIGDMRLGDNANRSIIFHTSTNWYYYVNGSGNNFTITDYDSTEFFKAEYMSGTTSKRSSMLNALYVINNGNVGIGITNPSAPLHVVSSGADDNGFILQTTGYNGRTFFAVHKLGFIKVRSSDLNGAAIHFYDNGDTKRGELSIGADSKFNWYSDALASTWMVFDNANGRLGIGTTTPQGELDVAGQTIVQGGVYTKRVAFSVPGNTNRRIRVSLSNYTAVRVVLGALRTNSGDSVAYWEGILNNNDNTAYSTAFNSRTSSGTISYTFTATNGSVGVNSTFDFDFNNAGSNGGGTITLISLFGAGFSVTETTY